jgi:hypothetical protein
MKPRFSCATCDGGDDEASDAFHCFAPGVGLFKIIARRVGRSTGA